jgi:hemerythrin superfamily protein
MPAKKTSTSKRTAPAKRATAKRGPSNRSAVAAARRTTKKSAAAPTKAATRRPKSGAAAKRAASSRPSAGSNARGTGRRGQPNAIELLKQDHRQVEELFARFEKTSSSGRARRQQLVGQMIEALSIHAAIEEQVFYPAARREVRDANEDVLEALEEHHVVKWTLSELDRMDPSDERYSAKVSVLMDSVRHHVSEEEKQLFPKIRKALGADRLRELGGELAAAKGSASGRPHPEASDTPAGNIVGKTLAAPFDVAASVNEATARRIRDFVS